MERRLSVILATDMVGYSRLMEADEVGTLKRLTTHRKEVIDPAFAKYSGRVVKEIGDGFLVEFPSVVAAVQCAVDIQRAITKREAEVAQDRKVAYRIGINLGDIIVEGDDIFGDGVNVAARLEQLAEPGGICISGTTYDHLKSQVDVSYDPLGEVRVKNIKRPVRAYRVLLDQKQGLTIRKSRFNQFHLGYGAAAGLLLLLSIGVGTFWWLQPPSAKLAQSNDSTVELSDKPSVAVLPLANLSNDAQQEYFADGLAADLITDLSRVSGLVVISRTSSFAFKDQAIDIREIGRKLGARYVVEGSVRKLGKHLRITAQLTKTSSGEHIWANRYDRDLGGLFEFQELVRKQVVQALSVKLSTREKKYLAKRPTTVPQAYDLYLRGLKQESYFTKDGNIASRQLFARAIELDPIFAAAYSKLAQAYSLAQENSWTKTRKEYAKKAITLAEKAVALDEELPQAHWALARIYSRQPFADPVKSMKAIERTVELDPNFADGFAFLASRLNSGGKAEEALARLEKAMRINPNFPFWYLFELGRAQFFLTNYDASVQSFRKAIERNPSVGWPRRWLIAAYGHLGKRDDAQWELLELESLNSLRTISEIEQRVTVHYPPYVKQFLDGLRKAGMPDK